VNIYIATKQTKRQTRILDARPFATLCQTAACGPLYWKRLNGKQCPNHTQE